jgi:hypothetical protein
MTAVATVDKKQYFTQETENAICAYIASTDFAEKSRIYNSDIKKPFEKIVENWIFKLQAWKYTDSYTDLSNDTITFLCERLNKYVHANGKAFSYFSVIARNYLILFIKKSHQKLKSNVDTENIDIERNLMTEESYKDFIEETYDFVEEFVKYVDANLPILFDSQKEMSVADSILELFRTRDNIENFNKKALYILIRERTGLKTQTITKTVNDIKLIYELLYKSFQLNDGIKLNPYKLQELIRMQKNKAKR